METSTNALHYSQWIFVDYNEDDWTHMVMNAATKSLCRPWYLTVNSTTKKVVAIAEDLDNDNELESDETAGLDDVKSRSWGCVHVSSSPTTSKHIQCSSYATRATFLVVIDNEERVHLLLPLSWLITLTLVSQASHESPAIAHPVQVHNVFVWPVFS
jgi:hypothetical protein